MSDYHLFHGDGRDPHDAILKIERPPPWRDPVRQYSVRASTYQAGQREIEAVNAALHLRRPLLVSGPPGCGKSSLAYAVDRELGLGGVLKWAINSRSTLAQGIYDYDAIGRLRDSNQKEKGAENIGSYIKLGPLGTALLSGERPRALLIDEIDKSDLDFPNDLLNVLEEGDYEISELARVKAESPKVTVRRHTPDGHDEAGSVTLVGGRIRCEMFPFVVITTNGERDLPPAFLRRCLRIDVSPTQSHVKNVVEAHFGQLRPAEVELVNGLIAEFVTKNTPPRLVALDQLLNAVFLLTGDRPSPEGEQGTLRELLLRALNDE